MILILTGHPLFVTLCQMNFSLMNTYLEFWRLTCKIDRPSPAWIVVYHKLPTSVSQSLIVLWKFIKSILSGIFFSLSFLPSVLPPNDSIVQQQIFKLLGFFFSFSFRLGQLLHNTALQVHSPRIKKYLITRPQIWVS